MGQIAPDASQLAEPRAPRGNDAALEMEDLPAPTDPLPSVDAGPVMPEDAGAAPIELDAGHDAGDADAAHAGDAARDAHVCREPWEPWECRG